MKTLLARLTLVLVLLGTVTVPVMAGQLNEAMITKVGASKLAELSPDREFTIDTVTPIVAEDGDIPLAYVIDLAPQGYLVVSADTNLPPVVAYSLTSDFGNFDSSGNPLLAMIETDLTVRRSGIADLPNALVSERQQQWNRYLSGSAGTRDERDFHQWPEAGSTPTGGWLRETWTQSAPYNNFCPVDPVTNSRSLAGCPSIAIGQILNYHRTIKETRFTDTDDYYHSFNGRNYMIDDDYFTRDFPSFPTLNNYLTELTNHYQNNTPITTADKAALVFACGVAAHQVYSSGGSGTFGVSQAFTAFQKFRYNTAELITVDSVDLYQRLALNVLDQLPALFASVTPAWDSGHNFVVDGYNTDNYFHINFGWGGAYNGWYLLPAEIPYGLSVVEGVIVDISPSPIIADGNDAPAEAVVLELPVSERLSQISSDVDADWYKFYVEVGTNLEISSELFGCFELDPKFWLYGPHTADGSDLDPVVFIASDDNSNDNNQPLITWQAPATGYYFLRIAHSASEPDDSGTKNSAIGAHFLTISETPSTDVEDDGWDSRLSKWELAQNYPNPFSRRATIHFTVPKSENVTLKIYDITGRLVTTLLEGRKDAGEYSVIWDGTDDRGLAASPGVYLYSLKTELRELRRHMTLIR